MQTVSLDDVAANRLLAIAKKVGKKPTDVLHDLIMNAEVVTYER